MLRLALALCLSLAAGQPQIFYSEPEGLAFLPAKSPKLIGVDGVTAMLSSLLSIPTDSLSHETGSQVTTHPFPALCMLACLQSMLHLVRPVQAAAACAI